MRKFNCVECGQDKEDMLVFVGSYVMEDGTVKVLPKGMYPYCKSCRRALQITDELNPGRDLRLEAKRALLAAVDASRDTNTKKSDRLDAIMYVVDDWGGSTDALLSMLGQRPPNRPPEVFAGLSDALGEIDPTTISSEASLTLLTAISSFRDKIENWKPFAYRSYEHFKATMGEESARGNLVGFI